jgi:hypothetical protein
MVAINTAITYIYRLYNDQRLTLFLHILISAINIPDTNIQEHHPFAGSSVLLKTRTNYPDEQQLALSILAMTQGTNTNHAWYPYWQ